MPHRNDIDADRPSLPLPLALCPVTALNADATPRGSETKNEVSSDVRNHTRVIFNRDMLNHNAAMQQRKTPDNTNSLPAHTVVANGGTAIVCLKQLTSSDCC